MDWNAYHFVAARLRDGRVVPVDGVTLRHDGPLEMCAKGLHASRKAWQALEYAPGPILCRVHCGGGIIEDHDKIVCRERTIFARIDATALLREYARKCALEVIHLWDAPDVVRRWLETGHEAIRDAAWDAAQDAAWAAAQDAALEAALEAAQDAAWATARATAWATARAATRAAQDAARAAARAARDAAWAATRAAQDAARAAAWAAQDAAWDAWAARDARDAARDARDARADAWASRDAAWDAARDAQDAAWDAARRKQRRRFTLMVNAAFDERD